MYIMYQCIIAILKNKMKVTSTSEIFKTLYHSGSYSLLFRRGNYKVSLK